MLTLNGFAASNYYNKVKLALLEKEIAFDEKLVWPDQSPELLVDSPMGKVPFLTTPQGPIAESQVIFEYLEDSFPQTKSLLPQDSYASAKVRELCVFIDIHLELVARRLYPQAFFGGQVSAGIIEVTRKDLEKGVRGLKALARFSPYIAGSDLTLADCSAYTILPVVSVCSKAIYGDDVLAELPMKPYIEKMRERASVQKVDADRKANQELMASRRK